MKKIIKYAQKFLIVYSGLIIKTNPYYKLKWNKKHHLRCFRVVVIHYNNILTLIKWELWESYLSSPSITSNTSLHILSFFANLLITSTFPIFIVANRQTIYQYNILKVIICNMQNILMVINTLNTIMHLTIFLT